MFRAFSQRDGRGHLKSFYSTADAGLNFSPTSIAGIALWLSADSLSLSDGSAVPAWADQSGKANNAQYSYSAPTFKTNILNGLPVVRFNGNNLLALATNLTSTAASIFAVYNRTSGSGAQVIAGLNTVAMYSNISSGNWGVYTSGYLDSGVATSNTFRICSAIFRNYNDVDLITGTALVNQTSGTSYPNRGRSSVGADPSGQQFHVGDIAEIIIYNSALSVADRNSIISYLQSKYAL